MSLNRLPADTLIEPKWFCVRCKSASPSEDKRSGMHLGCTTEKTRDLEHKSRIQLKCKKKCTVIKISNPDVCLNESCNFSIALLSGTKGEEAGVDPSRDLDLEDDVLLAP